MPDTIKTTFNLDIESTDKARSINSNIDRALVKKIVLMLGSKENDTIINTDIYDTSKYLYFSEKGVKRSFSKVYIQQGFSRLKRSIIFQHFRYLYELTDDLVVRLKSNSSGNLILCEMLQ